jgi:hypothetical protein
LDHHHNEVPSRLSGPSTLPLPDGIKILQIIHDELHDFETFKQMVAVAKQCAFDIDPAAKKILNWGFVTNH